MTVSGSYKANLPGSVPGPCTGKGKMAGIRFGILLAALTSLPWMLTGCGASTGSAAAVPTFTPAAGSYNSAQTVTISDATAGAVLHCTTDGTVPTTSSPVCSEPTTVTKTETLSAIAAEPGGSPSAVATAAYTINLPAAATPVISPAAGTYLAAQSVTITDATVGATIYYTTDGTTPTAASAVYSGAIAVPATETVSAIAIASGYADSNVASAAFVINLPAPTPVITPAGGTFTGAQSVTITDSIPGAMIYYTLDGTTPTQSSTKYSGAITVAVSETVNAIAIAPGYSLSPVATVVFSLVTAVPTISPAGGTFTSVQSVTIADATAGASIYYTVTPNGGTPAPPTASSTLYTGAIPVTASETIEAIAVAAGSAQSATASAQFTVNLPPAATPVISPAGGSFSSAQTVTITDSTSAAAIYYTTNGSTPSATNGILYSGPISVTASETIEAVAVAYGSSNSAVASAAFSLVAATPTISPVGGTYSSVQSVTIADTTSGAAIYYTTNGSTPSATNGTLYSGAITVSSSETVQAIAVASGYSNSAVASASFTLNLPAAATPVISPAGGTFASQSTPSVTITDSTPGAVIYYTLDGSLPSATNGIVYTAPFTAAATETVKATAIAFGYSNSAVSSASFTINQALAATPVFSPAAGPYTTVQTVTLSDTTANAKIYYTTDGSTPSAQHGTLYSSSINVAATETIKAIATATGFNDSAIASATFTISLAPVPTPVISPGTGTYSAPQTVTITDSISGATIYYTLDNTTPTQSSTQYSGAITVSSSETVQAIAVAPGYSTSAEAGATFTLTAATPVIAPAGGTFTTATESVTITDTTPGVSIYYTVTAGSSGTVPTTSSTLYSGAFTVSATDTVEAIAVEAGYSNSATASALFTKMVPTGPTLSGTVFSGSLPIQGASVQMYAAGTAGYGSAATALGNAVTTGTNGSFSVPYTCPSAPGDLIYIVATGGSTSSMGASNGGSALMTALGACASLPTTGISINEVTTIASVYALSGFASIATGGGINVGAPAPSNTCSNANIGNSSCNYPGLVNAFATVNNLVDTGSGTALTITPAYAANPLPYLNTSTVPQSRIDTLADILATCVDASSGCSTLFGDVGGSAPTDTIQVALDIALNPGTNVAPLYGLLQATPPYVPTLVSAGDTSAPSDWTLAITYTGAGLGVDPNGDYNDNITNYALAIDGGGNVWVTGATANSQNTGLIAGFNNAGAPLTPATQYDPVNQFVTQFGGFGPGVSPFSSGVSQLIIDPSNNLWITDNSFTGGNGNDFSEVSVSPNVGVPPTLAVVQLASAYMGAVAIGSGETSFAFDPSVNLWLSSVSPQLNEYDSGSGNLLNTYVSNESSLSSFTFDTNGSLWASGSGDSVLFNPSTGNAVATYANTSGASLAAGAAGNMYTCNATSDGYLVLNSGATGGPVSTYSVTAGCNPLVVDGAGNIWSVSGTNTGNFLTQVSKSGSLLTPAGGYTGSSSAEGPTTYDALYIAVDGSGNLWALNQNNSAQGGTVTGNVLVQFVGVAAPTVAPLAVATQNGAQGTKP